MSRRAAPGALWAGGTAVVSGVAIFVNSYAVHAVAVPSVYTTAKNLVAVVLLAGVAACSGAWRGRRGGDPLGGHGRLAGFGLRQWLALAYVGVVGGGLAFVVFFDGLATTSATPAAFWRDTLLVWVALLAVPLLHERLAWWNLAVIAAVLAGEIGVAGGVGHLAADKGELLVAASSLLWALEIVAAKVVLAELPPGVVALVRMGVGAATLVVYLATTGALGALGALDARQVGWVVLTGSLLAVYVATWMTALARARAVDVTSILAGAAVVTWLAQAAAGTATAAPHTLGLVLVAAGAGAVVWGSARRAELR